jgi:N-formylmaleamate deformylase
MLSSRLFLPFIPMLVIFLITANCSKEHPMEWESSYVVANDIKVHFTRTGYEKPLIVAVHGITDNGLCWSKVARNLNDSYDLLMVDARGHGLTEAPSWGYDLQTYMEDLKDVIDKLDLKKPILLGHSLGAVTVTMLAARYPGMTRAIILEDPVGLEYQETKPDTAFINQRRSEIVQRKKMTLTELVQLGKTEVHPEWQDPDDFIPWAQAKQQVHPEVAALFGQIGGLVQYFPDIDCPVLILKADADEAQRLAHQELFAKMPDHQLIHIQGAGHNIRREQFDSYIQHIRQFLQQL